MTRRLTAAALGLALLTAAACGGGGSTKVAASDSSGSTTTARSTTTTSTTASTSTSTTVAATDTTTTAAPASEGSVGDTTPPPPSPADDPCWQSHDEACGPLQWSPPNAPLQVSVSVRPEHPAPGQPFSVVVTLHDDDDQPLACGSLLYETDTGPFFAASIPCDPTTSCDTFATQHGTWPSPPSTGGGDSTMTFDTTAFSTPGAWVYLVEAGTVHANCSFLGAAQVQPHGSISQYHFTVDVG